MKNGYATTLLLSFALLSLGAVAQGDNTTFNWKFEEANKLMEEKFYNQAADIWKGLVETQPENANLNYKLGYSYFNSYNQGDKALPYLEKAAQLRNSASYGGFNSSGYDPFDPKETNAPVEVDYYLGKAYHMNGDLDKADLQYQKFIDETDDKHLLYAQAKRGKEQTANARELMKTPKNYEVFNVGSVVNAEYPDFSPDHLRGWERALLHQSPDPCGQLQCGRAGRDRRPAARSGLCELQGPRRQLANTGSDQHQQGGKPLGHDQRERRRTDPVHLPQR